MFISDHAIFVLVSLLIYISVTRIGRHRRTPSAALAWVLLLIAFPYLGLPLFLMFGTRKLWRRAQRHPPAVLPARAASPASADEVPPPWALELLASMGMPEPRFDAGVTFQRDGAGAFIAVLKLIAEARHDLAVCTFLLGQDAQAEQIVRSLRAAALRGVRVRLLLDAVGSLRVTHLQYQTLLASGVEVRRYMPLLHNPVHGRSNLRNHRKLLIVDGGRVWAGGRNLAGEYFSGLPGEPAWLDLSFTLSGQIARDALALFDRDWGAARPLPKRLRRHAPEAQGEPSPARKHALAVEHAAPRTMDAGQGAQASGTATPSFHPASPATVPAPSEGAEAARARSGHIVQLLPSGPDLFDDTAHALLLTAAFQARERIVAVTPYFVPDEALLTAWCLAARRGVRIRLLVPQQSNHRLADLARMRALRQLVQVGAEVRLYPGMIHAKAVVVDDALGLAGSLNLDGRSLFLNFELMVAFYRPTDIQWLASWIEAHGEPAKLQDGRAPCWPRDVLEGMVRALAYQL